MKILNYEVIRKIGEGSMGQVFLAENVAIGQKVAIKVLSPKYAGNAALRERFRKEAMMLSGLNHPNIVKFLNFVENDSGVYLIMEYVSGQSLEDFIHKKNGLIVEGRAVPMIRQILDAFTYAHSHGIVHRDITPGNIIITDDGNVKILDFGIAQIFSEAKSADAAHDVTSGGGSPLYMSPEQVNGRKLDNRSDIYSIGVVIYEMLTGKKPYDRDKMTAMDIKAKVVKDPLPRMKESYEYVSDVMQELVDRATDKNPDRRFHNCADMHRALYRKAVSKKKGGNSLIIWISTAVALLMVAVGWFVWDYMRVKTRYYMDYMLVDEVPVGLGGLNKSQIANRDYSYKMEYSRGKLRSMTLIDSEGELLKPELNMMPMRNFTKVEYVYSDNGNVDYKNVYDDRDDLLYKLDYDAGMKHAKALDEDDEPVNPVAKLVGDSIAALNMGVNSKTVEWVLTRDREGRLEKVIYAGADGEPLNGRDGRAGMEFKYYPSGRISEYVFIDADGKRVASRDGYASMKISYDDEGKIKETRCYDAAGKEVAAGKRESSPEAKTASSASAKAAPSGKNESSQRKIKSDDRVHEGKSPTSKKSPKSNIEFHTSDKTDNSPYEARGIVDEKK